MAKILIGIEKNILLELEMFTCKEVDWIFLC